MKNQIEPIGVLVLKCDGLQTNRNIPDEVTSLCEKKYADEEGNIYSKDGKFCYNFKEIKQNNTKYKQKTMIESLFADNDDQEYKDDDAEDGEYMDCEDYDDYDNPKCTCALLVNYIFIYSCMHYKIIYIDAII